MKMDCQPQKQISHNELYLMSGSRKGVFVRNMYYILDPKFVIKKNGGERPLAICTEAIQNVIFSKERHTSF